MNIRTCNPITTIPKVNNNSKANKRKNNLILKKEYQMIFLSNNRMTN